MGMLNDLPFNTNPLARRVELRPTDTFDVYFLDDNTHLCEEGLHGFWVKSRARAEIVLRTAEPVEQLTLELTNGPVANMVTASLDGQAETVELEPVSTPRAARPTTRFTYGDNYIYRFVIDSRRGGVPMMYSNANEDYRRIGVFVTVNIDE